MPTELKLPDIGEGVAEGEVLRWMVKEGDAVKEGQPLVEVMTDKVNVELPSPTSGTILKILANVGNVVKVGEVLVFIGSPSEKMEDVPAKIVAQPSPGAAEYEALESKLEAKSQGTILATPATRKLAQQLGVDLVKIKGTGTGGRITDEDVRLFAAGSPASLKPTELLVERIPIRGLRRKIFDHMSKAVHTAALVSHVDEADFSELVATREHFKALAEKQNVKLTYLPFVLKALVAALKEYPILNANVDDEKEEIIIFKEYNIGIATATEQGLIVPVVKNVDEKTVIEIAREIERLTASARDGGLQLEDIRGGTFSVTNIGSIGGLFATPIINYPEVAILGLHRIQKRAVVKDTEIEIRDMTYLSLTFDHRMTDGDVAARFVTTLIKYLENPKLLFS